MALKLMRQAMPVKYTCQGHLCVQLGPAGRVSCWRAVQLGCSHPRLLRSLLIPSASYSGAAGPEQQSRGLAVDFFAASTSHMHDMLPAHLPAYLPQMGPAPHPSVAAAAAAPMTEMVETAQQTACEFPFCPSSSLDIMDDSLWCEGVWLPEQYAEEAKQCQPATAAAPPATRTPTWTLASLAAGAATAVSPNPRKPEMQDRHIVVCDIARLAHSCMGGSEQQGLTKDDLGPLYSQDAPSMVPVAKPAVYAMSITNMNLNSSSSCDEYDASALGSSMDEHETLHGSPSAPEAWQLPSLLTGVFDGHRGCLAANTAVSHLAHLVLGCTEVWSKLGSTAHAATLDDTVVDEVEAALHSVFMSIDKEVGKQMQMRGTRRHDGATALLGLQVGRHLFVANAGDSRAVLSRRGAAIRLSKDHTPDLEQERLRIFASGGSVYMYKGAWRVVLDHMATGGGIKMCAVSRAVGDLDFKHPCELISAAPDVAHMPLQPLHDQFVVYATDGIWGVMTDQEAVNLVQSHMAQTSAQGLTRAEQAEAAAKALMADARERGSLDDITVVVTPLEWAWA